MHHQYTASPNIATAGNSLLLGACEAAAAGGATTCGSAGTSASGSALYASSTQAGPYYDCIPSLEAKYVVGPEIGRGSCSVVREATSRTTGRVYVVKVCPIKDSGYNPEEADITMSARHAHIVRGIDVFMSSTHSAIVMEDLRSGGELFHVVHRCSSSGNGAGGGLPEERVALYVHGVLSALQHLHDVMGVVHRDIKLENVMLQPQSSSSSAFGVAGGGRRASQDTCVVKLIDFGFSKRVGHTKVLNACCGSPNYMSPEMLRASRTQDQNVAALPTRHQPYGNEVDLWATGVLMYVMLAGKYPFYHERRSVWHKAILMGQYNLPSTVSISAAGRDLLSKLLSVRAEDRLSAGAALRHPWFTECGVPQSATSPHETSADACRNSLAQLRPPSEESGLVTPTRKTRTPPNAEETVAVAAAAAYHSAPQAVVAAAFTPPHNHALFIDTPVGKSTSGRGTTSSGGVAHYNDHATNTC